MTVYEVGPFQITIDETSVHPLVIAEPDSGVTTYFSPALLADLSIILERHAGTIERLMVALEQDIPPETDVLFYSHALR